MIGLEKSSVLYQRNNLCLVLAHIAMVQVRWKLITIRSSKGVSMNYLNSQEVSTELLHQKVLEKLGAIVTHYGQENFYPCISLKDVFYLPAGGNSYTAIVEDRAAVILRLWQEAFKCVPIDDNLFSKLWKIVTDKQKRDSVLLVISHLPTRYITEDVILFVDAPVEVRLRALMQTIEEKESKDV